MRHLHTFPAAIVIAVFASQVASQELHELIIPAGRSPAGSAIPVQIRFSGVTEANSYCGLEVNYGDGEIQAIRAGQNGAQDFPLKLTHIYKVPGQYAIAVVGKFVTRGLKSASACGGPAKQASITIFDEAAEKAKQEAARRERDLADREQELRRVSERLERDRKEQAAKEQSLREQELANRERELEAKERLLKQKEQQQQPKPVATKPAPKPTVVAPDSRTPIQGF